MKKIKKTIAALLCAMILAAVALPALAVIWNDDDTVSIPSIGVSAYCKAILINKTLKGNVELTYLPDPSNHMPESDYTTGVKFKFYCTNNTLYTVEPPFLPGMTGYFQHPSTLSVTEAHYMFKVNGNIKTTIDYP